MLQIGSLVDGKYKILSEIGHGGMSVVYMAINEKANKTWAVKEVRKDGVLDFEAVKQGLVVETDLLKRLKHPNLPSIVDVIEDDEAFLIVMDYIEGNALSRALEEYGAQPQEDVIEWAKQICNVLGYLHSRPTPIIYRDMKPANIMLKPDGNITLIDFGTAREFKTKNLADTTCLGTVGYAAPEQFGGMGQTDARTDIYCLGATLYHLVTGFNPSEPPYEIRPIREINPALSGGLEKIIMKCTQRNPDDRYQSAAELMFALEHYDEIDDKYRKKQKIRLASFIGCLGASLCCLLGSLICSTMAEKETTDQYQVKLESAKATSDYKEQIRLYEECIDFADKAGKKEGYLGLIETFRNNDYNFDLEEAAKLERILLNNRAALQANPKESVEVYFETGKLFWYYYDIENSNFLTRATLATKWFGEVENEKNEKHEYYNEAQVYASVGRFYRDIQMQTATGEDGEKYKGLYEDLIQLMKTTAASNDEKELIRLELLELGRSAIQQYATKFKRDGITQEQLNELYAAIEYGLENVDVKDINDTEDVLAVKKKKCLSLMQDTKKAIETAYGTRIGGTTDDNR